MALAIGFLPSSDYVAAAARCGAEVAVGGVDADGQAGDYGMLVVRRDSDIASVADLDGKSWAVPDDSSLTSFFYFQALLAEAGVTPGEITVVPGDNTAMLAVLNGEADFATGRFLDHLDEIGVIGG